MMLKQVPPPVLFGCYEGFLAVATPHFLSLNPYNLLLSWDHCTIILLHLWVQQGSDPFVTALE